MIMRPNNNLQDFLKPTYYCDCDNKKIIDLAKKLTITAKNDREKAIMLFDFVRDRYLYSFGDWRITASDLVKQKRGMCTTKTNLLVALLRSVGIPAGFRIIRINAQNVFKIFAKLKYLYQKMSTNSVHIFASVYLDGKWIDVDPSLDIVLAKGLEKVGYSKNISNGWNGYDDFVNFIPTNEIVKDLGLFSDIDNYHKKKRKTARFFFILLSQLNIAYYRLLGKF